MVTKGRCSAHHSHRPIRGETHGPVSTFLLFDRYVMLSNHNYVLTRSFEHRSSPTTFPLRRLQIMARVRTPSGNPRAMATPASLYRCTTRERESNRSSSGLETRSIRTAANGSGCATTATTQALLAQTPIAPDLQAVRRASTRTRPWAWGRPLQTPAMGTSLAHDIPPVFIYESMGAPLLWKRLTHHHGSTPAFRPSRALLQVKFPRKARLMVRH